jgi:hypothetical protein
MHGSSVWVDRYFLVYFRRESSYFTEWKHERNVYSCYGLYTVQSIFRLYQTIRQVPLYRISKANNGGKIGATLLKMTRLNSECC